MPMAMATLYSESNQEIMKLGSIALTGIEHLATCKRLYLFTVWWRNLACVFRMRCFSTALDPAGPMLEDKDIHVKLDQHDATFIDAIHTNGDSILKLCFGSSRRFGHVDFFPNGGQRQPGCTTPALAVLTGYYTLFSLFLNNPYAYVMFLIAIVDRKWRRKMWIIGPGRIQRQI